MGPQILTGVLYSALERYTSPPTEVGRRNCIESLRRVARRAETAGLTLGIEAVNRYETNLVNTANQAADLIVEIGAPNVVVHLDAYHMNIEEASFASAISTAQSRLGYVHIAESNRGRLGAGTIDFEQLKLALADISYAGPLVFESFSANVDSAALAGSLALWRSLWDDPVVVARAARDFIAVHFDV